MIKNIILLLVLKITMLNFLYIYGSWLILTLLYFNNYPKKIIQSMKKNKFIKKYIELIYSKVKNLWDYIKTFFFHSTIYNKIYTNFALFIKDVNILYRFFLMHRKSIIFYIKIMFIRWISTFNFYSICYEIMEYFIIILSYFNYVILLIPGIKIAYPFIYWNFIAYLPELYNYLKFFFLSNFLTLFLYLFLTIFTYILFSYEDHEINELRRNSVISFNFILFFFCIYFIFMQNIYPTYYCLLYNKYLDLININFSFAMDNLSTLFIILTCFLFNIALIVSLYNIKYKFKLFVLNLLLLQFLIILTFMSANFFWFYFFFELSLIPMFILIGIWGSRQRKIYAMYQFFYYTVFGSIFLLSALLILYSTFGTFNIDIIMNSSINYDRQLIIWILVFLGFSTKIPLVPVHGWLPEAHVEAPTAGSVILAGILLKLGTYGLLRFLLPSFNFANYFYLPFVNSLCLISIIYISFIILTQVDLKKIIAYSSILHMNFIILGLFSGNTVGLTGSIFLMFSHALTSSGLFICAGILYDRYKTRNIMYFGGVAENMPNLATIFFLLTLSNISFPLTSNFIGELTVCLGLVENNFFLVFILLFSTFFNTLYSIWLYNRIFFGKNEYLLQVSDVSEREAVVLYALIFWIFLLGINPNILIDYILDYVYLIIEYLIH